MPNPLPTFDMKDALVILLLFHAAATGLYLSLGMALWGLAHFGVWK